MESTKKNRKYKVGDVVYFKYCDSRDGQHQGVSVITHIRGEGEFPYRLDIMHGDQGWLASEQELRPLTKLELALK